MISAIVGKRRPETGWPTHDQIEVTVIGDGGSKPHPLKRVGMSCG